MNQPVRTTLVFGLISALVVIPFAWGLSGLIGWSMALKLALWVDLTVYALLLARWSASGLIAIGFPLVLLLGIALWPGVGPVFILLGLGVFSWIRSGICFCGAPLRAAAAEIVTVAGGAGLVVLLGPRSELAWAISIWLFFLVQTLYFYIVPVTTPTAAVDTDVDPFNQAFREAQRVLDEG
jgi:hypothetical protein